MHRLVLRPLPRREKRRLAPHSDGCENLLLSKRQRSRISCQRIVVILVLTAVLLVTFLWNDAQSMLFTEDFIIKDMFVPNRVPAMSSKKIQEGAQHRVELYSFRQPVDDDNINNNYNNNEERTKQEWSAWEDFPNETSHSLMHLDDANLISRKTVVSIDDAHRQGLLHRGVWLAVLRQTTQHSHRRHKPYQILLLQRQLFLKTCPGAWSLLGEHSDTGETWIATAQRALLEELQLDNNNNNNNTDPSSDQQFVNLFPGQSVLVRTEYVEVHRREMQATGLFAIVLGDEQIKNQMQPDKEVADTAWVDIAELYNGTRVFCNEQITSLAALVGRRLVELGYS